MALFRERRLAKSLVAITFLCLGGILINIAFELHSRSTKSSMIRVQDYAVIKESTTDNVITTQNNVSRIKPAKVKSLNGHSVLPVQPLNSQNASTTPVEPTVHAQPTPLPPCKKGGENLVGRMYINQTIVSMKEVERYENMKDWVLKGGAWRPTTCQAISKVAIIVPYRNRYLHLKVFLRHIHPILKRQLLDYRVIVVEQNNNTLFNRAILLNIGYKEALKLHDFQCFVFHDVDHMLEDDRNYYGCRPGPTHLSIAVDKWHYRLPYANMFGGVSSFTKEHFELINGFSNKFWGWGGEDDDSYKRILAVGLKLLRPKITIGRYTALRIAHKSAKGNPARFKMLKDSKDRMFKDGLNTLKYDILKMEEHLLYTNILVNVDPNAV